MQTASQGSGSRRFPSTPSYVKRVEQNVAAVNLTLTADDIAGIGSAVGDGYGAGSSDTSTWH